MKLKKLTNNIIYTAEMNDYLNTLKPFNQTIWENKTNDMKKFKTFIRAEMKNAQDNKCAYCGFPLDVTSGSEIEHIAPKANKLYPQFMFEKYNLVLACHLCNGRSNKGEKNTIKKYNDTYTDCEFCIVHPYLDDPDLHYDYIKSSCDGETAIIIVSKSDKATFSIDMLDLNNEARILERAKQVVFIAFSCNSDIDQIIEEILLYK